MFGKRTEVAQLKELISAKIEELSNTRMDDPDFEKKEAQITRLYKLQEMFTPKRVSPDTLALIGSNLIGLILILHYEKINVLTSKALGFVTRLR